MAAQKPGKVHNPSSCPSCGLRYNCLCPRRPALTAESCIVLLMHPREQGKATNTGRLMTETLPACRSEIWSRTEPPQGLLDDIANPGYFPVLLFPAEDAISVTQAAAQAATEMGEEKREPLFIILDATWQEARKMLRQSPWLAGLPKARLDISAESAYHLRRNQKPGNLCTCEVGIHLLAELGHSGDAAALSAYFFTFLRLFEADRQHIRVT
ncbi:DTW domain-containing protein [Parasalinivibrio latis]|uniref:tRNA-uridine aminocarboxypropyltransferase n=1 Tax=Parasalinivibrio latis TaxID=2952610 RepID=UPI0030DEF5E5